MAKFFGCEDASCITERGLDDYTWYWMLRAAQDGDFLRIENYMGGALTAMVNLGDGGNIEFTIRSMEGIEESHLPMPGNDCIFTIDRIEAGAPVDLYTFSGREEFQQNATGGAYGRRRFDPGQVDWIGAGLDVLGIVVDIFTLGIAGRLANGAKLAKSGETVGKGLAALDVTWGYPPVAIKAVTGDLSGGDVAGLTADVAGLAIPIGPDLVSLGLNFGQAFVVLP